MSRSRRRKGRRSSSSMEVITILTIKNTIINIRPMMSVKAPPRLNMIVTVIMIDCQFQHCSKFWNYANPHQKEQFLPLLILNNINIPFPKETEYMITLENVYVCMCLCVYYVYHGVCCLYACLFIVCFVFRAIADADDKIGLSCTWWERIQHFHNN